MKKIYISLACLSVMTAFSSCNDFLDVRPKGEQVENELFETAKGFEDAIYGVYGSMASNSVYGKDMVWGVPEILGQNFNCTSLEGEALAKYNYKDENVRLTMLSIWTEAYKTIGYANNVLQNLEKKDPESMDFYDLYKGEMLGVRAMMHFDLLRLFAPTDQSKQGIPYVTSYSFSVKPIVTVGEAYKSIVKDLTDAEALLAKNDESNIMSYPRLNENYDKFQNYRETHLNVWAVRALLARVYWYFGDNAKAAEYACKVVDSGRFPLVDVTEVQSAIAGVLSPKETVFGIYSRNYLEVSRSYLYNYMSYHSYDPYDNASGVNRLLPWQALYKLDIDPTVQDFRVNQFRSQNANAARSLKLVDYLTLDSNTGSSARPELISGVSLINISEMYIIAADALLSSNAPKAAEYFNAETKSRGLTPKDASELTAEMIYNEFHKETYCLGQHWFNMKRLGRDIQSNLESRIIPGSDEIYVIPIPEEEFEYRPQ